MSGYSDLASLVTFRPLDVNAARPGVGQTRRSAFKASWSSTVDLLHRELWQLDAKQVVLEIDVREQDFRIDGMPRANTRAASPAIVLTLQSPHGPLRYEVATFDDWQDNVRAVALALEALRAVDRYGVTKRGEQYAGWKALPSGSGAPSPARGRELIAEHGSLRAALMATHPDRGGDARDFAAVQAAREASA